MCREGARELTFQYPRVLFNTVPGPHNCPHAVTLLRHSQSPPTAHIKQKGLLVCKVGPAQPQTLFLTPRPPLVKPPEKAFFYRVQASLDQLPSNKTRIFN